jgi:hypothetical protein
MSRIIVVDSALSCLAWSVATGQPSARSVRGTTRDAASGQPVAGALVEVRSETFRAATRSDEEGAFRLGAVPAGRYRLSVLRIGFAELVRDLVLAGRDTTVELSLTAVARGLDAVRVTAGVSGIYGVVGTAKGLRPIPGAKVQVIGANKNVATDSTGGFFVAIPKEGIYVVRISREGYADLHFPIEVPKDRAVEASRLLDSTTKAPPRGLEVLWQDFDQRLRWRAMSSALVMGAELRRYGGPVTEALQSAPSVVARALRVGDPCLFVNGIPRPDWPLRALRVEDIESIEVYGPRGDETGMLARAWPVRGGCGGGSRGTVNRGSTVAFVVVWLRP